MARSQDIAGAVALKYLGYDVTLRAIGALISEVVEGSPAAKAGLQPTDVIVGVDGTTVRTTADLRRLISRHKPGERVRLTVRSGSGLRQVRVGTIAGDQGRPLIGILVDQATQVKLPIAVRIDAGSIGGPSAGPRLCVGRARGARTRRRPWLPGRGDRRARAGRLGDPDRRGEAKSDRRAPREGGRLPCASWG